MVDCDKLLNDIELLFFDLATQLIKNSENTPIDIRKDLLPDALLGTDNSVTFIDPLGLTYSVSLPESSKQQLLLGQAYKKNSKGMFETISPINVSWFGLCVEGDNRWFAFKPTGWEIVQKFIPKDFHIEGKQAFYFFEEYQRITCSLFAIYYLDQIKKDSSVLAYLRDHREFYLSHPLIKEELVKAYLSHESIDKKKFNSRMKISKGLYQLYYWQAFYRQQGFNKEEACHRAMELHPEHIPDDWGKELEDPSDIPLDLFLKKVTALDKLSRISQKNNYKPLLKK